ncbi:MAG TPA: cell wall-binding repeat-containing protein [Solirubrobacteraceae bacterium]|nr:cell wall-binding repeat-containing protein [Solirubrobacteraceae bacterium]
MSAHPIRPAVVAALVAFALLTALLGGCGGSDGRHDTPTAGGVGSAPAAGAPSLSTKNTTRLGGADPVDDAAAVARAVYPGLTVDTRPAAVTLVSEQDWATALAASALAGAPLRAPLLYATPGAMRAAGAQALRAIAPSGSPSLGKAQVITVGRVSAPPGYATHALLPGGDRFALAGAIAGLLSKLSGTTPRQVLVVGADGPPAFAMPAAGLAAESGAPILLVSAAGVPRATGAVLAHLKRPTMYVVGPSAAVSDKVLAGLRRYGPVIRIGAADPVSNAIAVARFSDGAFGWNVNDPGHGLVFVNQQRPADAAAAASLSASGEYGPLLLLDRSDRLTPALAQYLSNIQPGYTDAPRFRPVRGVYNHGWLIGDEQAISATAQAQLDALLEISPRSSAAAATPSP